MALARDLVSARKRSFERVSPESLSKRGRGYYQGRGRGGSFYNGRGKSEDSSSVSPVLGLILSVVTGHLIAQCPE